MGMKTRKSTRKRRSQRKNTVERIAIEVKAEVVATIGEGIDLVLDQILHAEDDHAPQTDDVVALEAMIVIDVTEIDTTGTMTGEGTAIDETREMTETGKVSETGEMIAIARMIVTNGTNGLKGVPPQALAGYRRPLSACEKIKRAKLKSRRSSGMAFNGSNLRLWTCKIRTCRMFRNKLVTKDASMLAI